jgi:hypothetical protein
MKDATWNGDYALNYNYRAPFYTAFSAITWTRRSYDQPIIDWVPKAKAPAMSHVDRRCTRVHMDLHSGSGDMGKWTESLAFAATDMLMHFTR